MKMTDRLYGCEIAKLPGRVLPGRFSVGTSELQINGYQYPIHTQLHYGVSGDLRISDSRTHDTVYTNILEEFLPSELIASAISEAVPEPIYVNTLTESDIREFVPMVPRINERIEKTDFEITLHDKLGFLEEVCRDPITLLNVEIERVHTDRARRIPPSALEYLASHDEDWSRRTISGVEPERVLSEIINDEYNIYENRVAATLVVRLYAYLLKRIHEVENLKGTIEEKRHIETESINNWHRNRVYGLWGEVVREDAAFVADNTLKFLQVLTMRVGKLMESPLYVNIPARERNENSILDTNIITNDQNYREVALLLNDLNQVEGRNVQKTEDEIYAQRMNEAISFEGFCVMLVSKALVELGYVIKPLPGKHGGDDSLSMVSPVLQDLKLRQEKNGNIELTTGSDLKIIIVPVYSQLSDLPEASNSLSDFTDQVDSKPAQKDTTYRVLLYPDFNGLSSSLVEEVEHLRAPNNVLMKDEKDKLIPIHVSPFSFYNIERIGLCLRRWIQGWTFMDYPREVPANNSIKTEIIHLIDSFSDSSQNGIVFAVQPFSPAELTQLNNHLRAEINKAAGKGRDYLSRKRELEKFQGHLPSLTSLFDDILFCPVCHTQVLAHEFHVTGANTYRCHCLNCEATWGLDACSNCNNPFPFIRPAIDNDLSGQNLYTYPEKRIGLDMIALPCCSGEGGVLHVMCSCCGHCSKHDQTHFPYGSSHVL